MTERDREQNDTIVIPSERSELRDLQLRARAALQIPRFATGDHTGESSDAMPRANILPRAAGAELMDQPDLQPEEIRTALRDLAGVNRWLGGWRTLRSGMDRLLSPLPPGTYAVLDVGTGGADLPVRLAQWARKRGYELRITATDIHPQTLALARTYTRAHEEITVEPADARALPYETDRFDFAVCSTTLHHFDEAAAVRVIAELARVARRGLVINDLRRGRLALWGARVLARSVWRRSRITRHDGPLSVRRAFTPEEVAHLAAQAGLTTFSVERRIPFRLLLSARFVEGGDSA